MIAQPSTIATIEPDLALVRDTFGAFGVPYWIESGTLLAHVRDGRLFASDRDLDIGMHAEDSGSINAALKQLSRSGYRVRREYYLGNLFNVTLVPHFSRSRRRIDIYFYRRSSDTLWAPANIPVSRLITAPLAGRAIDPIVRLALRAYWARFAREIHVDKRIWRRYFWIATWVVPATFVASTVLLPSGLAAPARWNEYLTYRYGDWQIPRRDWTFWTDDGAIRHQSPTALGLLLDQSTTPQSAPDTTW